MCYWTVHGTKKKLTVIKKYLQTNENGNITLQNLWDAAKTIWRRKFVEIGACVMKEDVKYLNFTAQGTRERTN